MDTANEETLTKLQEELEALEDANAEALAKLQEALEALQAGDSEADAQLQAALDALQQATEDSENLESKVELLEAELTETDNNAKRTQTVTAVVAGTSLACNVALAAIAIILERKKGLLTMLFSGVFKK